MGTKQASLRAEREKLERQQTLLRSKQAESLGFRLASRISIGAEGKSALLKNSEGVSIGAESTGKTDLLWGSESLQEEQQGAQGECQRLKQELDAKDDMIRTLKMENDELKKQNV